MQDLCKPISLRFDGDSLLFRATADSSDRVSGSEQTKHLSRTRYWRERQGHWGSRLASHASPHRTTITSLGQPLTTADGPRADHPR